MPRCGIVILAAGGSRRLGFPKQLVRVDGVSLLRRIFNEAIASVCKPVVVVLGARADELLHELDGLRVTVTVNQGWETGMGSSIRQGVTALLATDPGVDAILIALCDQPRVTSVMFDRLVATQWDSGKSICAAAYNQTLGTPAVFSSRLFSELEALPDAAGGRAIIQRHPEDVEPVELPDAAVDLDTPEDLIRLDTLARVSAISRGSAKNSNDETRMTKQ